ncbi:MAG: nuclear transport factor 2 family protein [Acidobacteriota bacterium]
MAKILRIALFALPLLFLLVSPVAASDADEAAVRAALENYFRGHATGDGAHHRKVFHPRSSLWWVRDGNLNERSSEEYISRHKGEAPEDEADRKRRIVFVDVTGEAAVAKIELDYPGVLITDYMSLLKIDGEWRIISKIFSSKR